MSEPVDKFCHMIEDLPKEGRQQVIHMCCLALGWRKDPLDIPTDGPDPVGELFRLPEMDDLRERLNLVVARVGVLEAMLIPGLLLYVTDFFRLASQPSATSTAIDHDLDWLRKLEEWKKLPAEERPAGFTDDMIERAIPAIKAKMTLRTGQRAPAEMMLQRVETDWKKILPQEYWQDWLKRMAEES